MGSDGRTAASRTNPRASSRVGSAMSQRKVEPPSPRPARRQLSPRPRPRPRPCPPRAPAATPAARASSSGGGSSTRGRSGRRSSLENVLVRSVRSRPAPVIAASEAKVGAAAERTAQRPTALEHTGRHLGVSPTAQTAACARPSPLRAVLLQPRAAPRRPARRGRRRLKRRSAISRFVASKALRVVRATATSAASVSRSCASGS